MLTRKTYTPALEAEAAPILPGATAAIRRQAVLELARLAKVSPRQEAPPATFGEKLTARGGRMAYFSTASVKRPVMGRPLGEPATTFAALLFARLSGHSRKRAEELLRANPNAASGAVWSVAGHAASEGIRSAEDFEKWLQREEQESSSI
jgi:hypothetical protein